MFNDAPISSEGISCLEKMKTKRRKTAIRRSGVPTRIFGLPNKMSGVPTKISGVPTKMSGIPIKNAWCTDQNVWLPTKNVWCTDQNVWCTEQSVWCTDQNVWFTERSVWCTEQNVWCTDQNVWCTDQNSNTELSEHKNKGYAALNPRVRVSKISNNETHNPSSSLNCSHLWLIEPVSSARNGSSRLFLWWPELCLKLIPSESHSNDSYFYQLQCNSYCFEQRIATSYGMRKSDIQIKLQAPKILVQNLRKTCSLASYIRLSECKIWNLLWRVPLICNTFIDTLKFLWNN